MARALIVLGFFLAGCPRSSSAPASSEPAPEPGNTGGEPVAEGACRTDDDCVISCAQPDSCCDQLCEPCRQAWTRTALEAHEQWRAGACVASECPVARCAAPTEQTTARCEAAACVVDTLPL